MRAHLAHPDQDTVAAQPVVTLQRQEHARRHDLLQTRVRRVPVIEPVGYQGPEIHNTYIMIDIIFFFCHPPDCEVHVEFLLGVLEVVVAAPQEESEEELVRPGAPHVRRVRDPGAELRQVPRHRGLVLLEHGPGVRGQLLLRHQVDRVGHQHPPLLLLRNCPESGGHWRFVSQDVTEDLAINTFVSFL